MRRSILALRHQRQRSHRRRPRASGAGVTAHATWLTIESQSPGNRESDTLPQNPVPFRNFIQADLSITNYCKRFKQMTDALGILGHHVSWSTPACQSASAGCTIASSCGAATGLPCVAASTARSPASTGAATGIPGPSHGSAGASDPTGFLQPYDRPTFLLGSGVPHLDFLQHVPQLVVVQ